MNKSFKEPRRVGMWYHALCCACAALCLLASVTCTEAVRLSEKEVEKKPETRQQPEPQPSPPPSPRQAPSPQPAVPSAEPRSETQPERTSQEPEERSEQRIAAETRTVSPERTDREVTREQTKAQKKSVTIDFDNVDMLLFIKFISEVTGKNFIVDRKVQGKVTIISPTKISVDEAYQVFLSVLEVHGFTTIDSGDVIKIVPSTEARGKNIETRLREEAIVPEDKVVTQLIRLDYANPDELKKLFAPLISKSSVIISYPPSGMLIVTDVLSNIQRLLRIIDAIDVVGVGEEISVIPIEHATAETLGQTLTTIFQATGRPAAAARTRGRARASATAPSIEIVADERTNSLIISASEHDTLRIKHLIGILDQETPRGTGNIRVHYLQHADAEDLAGVLTNLPTEQGKTAQKGKAPAISKDVQIVADKATNSLVITANKQEYQAIMDVVAKLDIARPMVYIEVLIMEVSTGKNMSIGVEWVGAKDNISEYDDNDVHGYIGSKPGSSILPSLSDSLNPLPDGLSIGILGESINIAGVSFPSIQAIINAFKTESGVHILQTPQLLTVDNEEAEINVVENRPFITRSGETDTAAYTNYEYKDVGAQLKITPQINQNRFVRLAIEQIYSTFPRGTSESDETPPTSKRTVKTTVVVKDGHTVVIGGLVGEQITNTVTGVPCLGGIPVLGWLFKSQSDSSDKTNLFVFLTPHVLKNPAEAAQLADEKRGGIDSLQESNIKMYERPPETEEKPEEKEAQDISPAETNNAKTNQAQETDGTQTDR